MVWQPCEFNLLKLIFFRFYKPQSLTERQVVERNCKVVTITVSNRITNGRETINPRI